MPGSRGWRFPNEVDDLPDGGWSAVAIVAGEEPRREVTFHFTREDHAVAAVRQMRTTSQVMAEDGMSILGLYDAYPRPADAA